MDIRSLMATFGKDGGKALQRATVQRVALVPTDMPPMVPAVVQQTVQSMQPPPPWNQRSKSGGRRSNGGGGGGRGYGSPRQGTFDPAKQVHDRATRTVSEAAPAPAFKKRKNEGLQSKPFGCDPCGRYYKTQQLLDDHLREHVVCGVDGCTASVHAAMLTEHRVVHTPFVKKLMKMTAEEVEKWREERRKNWPTVQNMERKAQEKNQANDQRKRDAPSSTEKEKDTAPPAIKKARAKKAPNAPTLPRRKEKKRTFLESIYQKERDTEADILVQCFMHIAGVIGD